MLKRFLVFGAHPDDIEFGCGGVVIKEIKAGNKVKHIVLSRGEAGTNGTPEQREKESRAAAKKIGAAIDFLDFGGDCHIAYNTQNLMSIAREIRNYRPHIILAPLTDENQHPDHAITGRLARDAARFARYGNVAELNDLKPHSIESLYYYSVTRSPLRAPDIIIDISKVASEWTAAIKLHKSQMKTRRYSEMLMMKAQALGLSIGTNYALGLYLNDPVRLELISGLSLTTRNF